MTGLGDPDERRLEVARRVEALRELLERTGAPGVLLSARRNFAWATAGGANHVVLATEEGAAPLLVTRDAAVVLAPINEAARVADEELEGLSLEVASLDWFDADAPVTEARRIAGDGLLEDEDEAVEEQMVPLRSVLSPFDQARLWWLGDRVRTAMAAALGDVSGGETEEAVAADLLAALARDGIRAPVVLAAADDRIARYRHPLPTARRVERRLMLVAVAERWGLHVAATRFRELDPPGTDLAARIGAAAAVHDAMVEATRPGATLGGVLDAARRAYAEQGFPEEWRLHHQGGSIAYQGRERVAVPGDTTAIAPGMAFAWNPSITGAKAEETFVLLPDGSPRVVTA